MHTIEQALLEIEDIVGGSYRTAFTNSELRKNPEEQIEFLKFNLEAFMAMVDYISELFLCNHVFRVLSN